MIERVSRKLITVELTRGDLEVLIEQLQWEKERANSEPESYIWSQAHDDLYDHLNAALARFTEGE